MRLEIQLILERAAEESERKSDRMGKVWGQKLRDASPVKVVTKGLPKWVDCVNGKLTLNPKKTATVRRIFSLADEGYGTAAIAKKLNDDGTPVIGRKAIRGREVKWSNSVVYFILTSRATIGEYIPYKTDRNKPNGDAVPGYFPPVVDRDTFYAVQGAMKTRAVVGAAGGGYKPTC